MGSDSIIDLNKDIVNPETELCLTNKQIETINNLINDLAERFTNIPDKEIGTKYTKDLGIEWLRQLAYKSIAVADLLDKKDNDNNGDIKS